MSRAAGTVALAFVAVWVIAHLLYIGPVQEAAEVTLVWVVTSVAICLLVAAIVLLGVALALGESRPVWLRFMRLARSVGTVLGCGLVVVGLLHYRDTEPQGEVRWLVLGLSVLVGAAIVHWWVQRTDRHHTA
jgi:uncharacterized membrane protein